MVKYSIIIGISRECYDAVRLGLVVYLIKESFGQFKDYEILIPYMYRVSGEVPKIDNCFGVPIPKDKMFSKGIQYNFAIRKARGEYIVVTDIDTAWQSCIVNKIEKKLFGKMFIGSDIAYINEGYINIKELQSNTIPEEKIYTITDCARNKIWMYGNLQIFPKSTMIDAQGYDERMRVWGEDDNDIYLRLTQVLEKHAIDIPIYHLGHKWRYCQSEYNIPREKFIEQNKKYREEKTFKRNTDKWGTLESEHYK